MGLTYENASIKIANNFSVVGTEPLDSRLVVDNVSNLTDGSITSPYQGMVVSVAGTHDLYIYTEKGIDGSRDYYNWCKISTDFEVIDSFTTENLKRLVQPRVGFVVNVKGTHTLYVLTYYDPKTYDYYNVKNWIKVCNYDDYTIPIMTDDLRKRAITDVNTTFGNDTLYIKVDTEQNEKSINRLDGYETIVMVSTEMLDKTVNEINDTIEDLTNKHDKEVDEIYDDIGRVRNEHKTDYNTITNRIKADEDKHKEDTDFLNGKLDTHIGEYDIFVKETGANFQSVSDTISDLISTHNEDKSEIIKRFEKDEKDFSDHEIDFDKFKQETTNNFTTTNNRITSLNELHENEIKDVYDRVNAHEEMFNEHVVDNTNFANDVGKRFYDVNFRINELQDKHVDDVSLINSRIELLLNDNGLTINKIDSFKEVADWISGHEVDFNELSRLVDENTSKVRSELQQGLDGLSKTIPVEVGKGNYSVVQKNSSCSSEGSYSVALGKSSVAKGQSSIALGEGSTANNTTSIAIGNYATSIGDSSTSIGYHTVSENKYETSLGSYNVSVHESPDEFGNGKNTLFSIGNGTYSKKHNAFEVRQNGDVYITIQDPTGVKKYIDIEPICLQDKLKDVETISGRVRDLEANQYTLQIASATVLGGVKIDGNYGLKIDSTSGILKNTYTYELPIAAKSKLGGVKIDGNGLEIDGNGLLKVKCGTGLSINNGILNNSYTLPKADANNLGGIKVGSGLTIDANGKLSATVSSQYTLQPATTTTLGGVIVGSGLSVSNGTISANVPSLPTASSSTLGCIKVGSGLSISNGVLSADVSSDYELPIATDTRLGGVKVNKTGLDIDENGNLSLKPAQAGTGTLGGIRPGTGLSVDSNGTLSVNVASKTFLGGIYVNGHGLNMSAGGTLQISTGNYLGIDSDGVLNVTLPTASSSTLGCIKVGSGLSISGGVLSANVQSIPTANSTTLGGVKVDGGGLKMDNGVIKVNAGAGLNVGTTGTLTVYTSAGLTINGGALGVSLGNGLTISGSSIAVNTGVVATYNKAGTFTAYQNFQEGAGQDSDIRFKTNIESVENVLDNVNKLDLIAYDWNQKGHLVPNRIGVSAQQLEEFGGSFGKLVHTNDDEDKTKSVEYDKLAVISLKAIQELTQKIERLEEEIKELKSK